MCLSDVIILIMKVRRRAALCLRRSKVVVGWMTLKMPCHLSLSHGACLRLWWVCDWTFLCGSALGGLERSAGLAHSSYSICSCIVSAEVIASEGGAQAG